ncbi:MAG: hypothetical protein ACT4QC_06280 [Planctomycetaceae bacterium]
MRANPSQIQQRRTQVANGAPSLEEFVDEYPLSSMLALFAAGVGVGVVVGHALCEPMHRAFERDDSLRRQIARFFEKSLPEAVARHLPT